MVAVILEGVEGGGGDDADDEEDDDSWLSCNSHYSVSLSPPLSAL
jgi:hypothetical protein